MSESANAEFRPSRKGAQVRRRQYRLTARLLKEYTARFYRIARHLGAYHEGRVPLARGAAPVSVVLAVNRYRATWQDIRDAALYASQMLVHYQLDEAESAELRVRLADAELAIRQARNVVNAVIATDTNQSLGRPIPNDPYEQDEPLPVPGRR